MHMPKASVHWWLNKKPGDLGLSPAPLPFPLEVAIDGESFRLGRGQVLDYARSLDFKHGFLRTVWRQALSEGQTVSVQALRFCSLADRNVAGQIVRLRLTKPG